MAYYIAKDDESSGVYLAHYGIEGQKWGLRRYQNYDGTLTSEGRERYHRAIARSVKKHESYTNQNKFGGLLGGLSNSYIHRNENKVQKKIDQEIDKVAGKESKTAVKARKMEDQLKQTYGTIEGAPRRKLSKLKELQADSENERKTVDKAINDIEKKYHKELLEAKMADMNVDVIEDGLKFLDAYLRNDPTATYDVPTFWEKVLDKKKIK